MEVTVKLFAVLGRYLPAHATNNTAQRDIAAGTSVSQLLRHLHVPMELTPLVMVNGLAITLSDHERTMLAAGDELAVFPPVAGG